MQIQQNSVVPFSPWNLLHTLQRSTILISPNTCLLKLLSR
jgi:hypothetical protein